MTTIAILGAGRVATTLATGLVSRGHDIIVGTRSGHMPDSWKGPEARFTSIGDAAAEAEIVINATPGGTSIEMLKPLAAALSGKVLIDVANATGRDERGAPQGLLYPTDSLAERLQAALPQTNVVKTLNTMLAPVMTNPGSLAGTPTVFLSGNDQAAKAAVGGLLNEMGWHSDQILDLGSIETARGPEVAMLLVIDVMKATGFKPFAVSPVR